MTKSRAAEISKGCDLREKRRSAGFSLAEVCYVLGRTEAWLSKVELGQISPGHTALTRIEEAIERLNSLRKSTWGSRDLRDLKLPRAKNCRHTSGGR